MPYIFLPKVATTSKLLTASLLFIYFLAIVIVVAYPDNKERQLQNSYSHTHSINSMELVDIAALFKKD
jgi:hypothetical protein